MQTCNICQQNMPSQVAEPLSQHDVPTKPWSVVGTDLFEFDDHQWLIISDYYSKYPIVKKLPHPSPSSVVVNVTKQVFAEHGIPDKVISDNGPHFASDAYREFARSWSFDHVTSSPRRPQGNGFIERNVRTVKSMLKKCKQSGADCQLALLHWRTTPVCANLDSPAQMLMGRRLKSTIPSRIRNDAPSQDDIHDTLYKRQGTQKHFFDQHAQHSDLPVLYPGQRVYVQDQATGMWEPAVVDSCTDDPRSYIVQNVNGRRLRRNRQHIRARHHLPPDTESTQNVNVPTENVNVPTEIPRSPVSPSVPRTEPVDVPEPTPGRYVTRSGRVVRSPRRIDV